MLRNMTAAFIAALASCAIATGGTRAQSVDDAFDCVIQPRAVIKIGSPAEGILREIGVRRGDIVEAGQVLARLDSSIEEAQVVSGEDDVLEMVAVGFDFLRGGHDLGFGCAGEMEHFPM